MGKYILVGVYLVTICLYFPLNHRRPRYFFETIFDKYVPTVPIFIVPYFAYFLLLFAGVILMWFQPNYVWYMKSILMAEILAIVFWFLVPNGVKKKKLSGVNLFEKLVNFIYSVDGGTNGFPSAHVFVSVINGYFLATSGWWWAAPLAILIVMSTVLVKQHYVVDILGGLVFAAVGVCLTTLV